MSSEALRALIIEVMELLTVILFALSAAFALWPVHPALSFVGSGAVMGIAAWWAGRPDPNRR